MIRWIAAGDPFPPVDVALKDPPGLLAVGGDLSAARLVDAYRRGIFPWFNQSDPVLWWSTDPRMVLFTDEFRVSHSLRKRLKRARTDAGISIRVDTSFEEVMRACAAPRDEQGRSWIVDRMITAYTELHRQGYAHSVETWIDGRLVGGLYGVAVGHMFYGESMFAHVTDASKVALAHLVDFARTAGMPMLDCQQQTTHLASLGARPLAREDFLERIAALVDLPAVVWPATLHWADTRPSASSPARLDRPA